MVEPCEAAHALRHRRIDLVVGLPRLSPRMEQAMSGEEIIGQRIQIVGDHPHTGEYGTVREAAKTATAGWGLVVDLENCPHWTDSCFVFESKNVRRAPRPVTRRRR